MTLKKVVQHAFVMLAMLSILSACGGGGDGGSSGTNPSSAASPSSAPTTLSGTVATGAALSGTVTVKDSSSTAKTVTVKIAADGTYTVDVTGMTSPYVLKADGTSVSGSDTHLCSAATQSDVGKTVNITPLTDLIIGNIAGTSATDFFSKGDFSAITDAKLSAAQAELQTALQPVLQAVGVDKNADLLHTGFSTDGKGLDAVLDIVKVSTDPAAKSATIQNIATGQSVTANLASGTIAGTFTVQTSAATDPTLIVQQAIVEIRACFKTLDGFWATSLPKSNDPALLALFDQAAFIDDGVPLTPFLAFVASQPALVGGRNSQVSINSIDASGTSALITYKVVLSNGFSPHTFTARMVKKNGAWQSQGNGRRTNVGFTSHAKYQPQTNTFSTGILVNIGALNGVAAATITAPGYSNTEWTMSAATTSSNDPQLSFGGVPFNRVLDLTSAPDLPATGQVFHVVLYDKAHNALDTYDVPLGYRPYSLAELGASMFASITSPTTDQLAAFRGGMGTVNWTLPPQSFSDEVGMVYGGNLATIYDAPYAFNPSATSFTAKFAGNAGNSTSLWVTVLDAQQRMLVTGAAASW